MFCDNFFFWGPLGVKEKLLVENIFHCVEKILTSLTPDKRKNNNKPKSQSFEHMREHGLHLFELTKN